VAKAAESEANVAKNDRDQSTASAANKKSAADGKAAAPAAPATGRATAKRDVAVGRTAASDAAAAVGDVEASYDAAAEHSEGVDACQEEVTDDLAASQAALAEMNDRFLRLQAEWDNYRKRTAAEREAERQRAAAHLVERILPVIDDMERAVGHIDTASIESLAEGITAVLAKLKEALAKEGVMEIDPEGEAFDINLHQAVARVDDPSLPDETVTQVYQKGYGMGDRVLRSAMVAVSSGGPARVAPDVSDAFAVGNNKATAATAADDNENDKDASCSSAV